MSEFPHLYNTHLCTSRPFGGNWECQHDDIQKVPTIWETVAGPQGYSQTPRLQAWPTSPWLVGWGVKNLIRVTAGVFWRTRELRNSPSKTEDPSNSSRGKRLLSRGSLHSYTPHKHGAILFIKGKLRVPQHRAGRKSPFQTVRESVPPNVSPQMKAHGTRSLALFRQLPGHGPRMSKLPLTETELKGTGRLCNPRRGPGLPRNSWEMCRD